MDDLVELGMTRGRREDIFPSCSTSRWFVVGLFVSARVETGEGGIKKLVLLSTQVLTQS